MKPKNPVKSPKEENSTGSYDDYEGEDTPEQNVLEDEIEIAANHDDNDTFDEQEVLEAVYDEELTTTQAANADDEDMETAEAAYYDDDQQNEVIIFKTSGEADDDVITYSIPISNSEQYDNDIGDSDNDTAITKDPLGSSTQSYEIIDGYLVPIQLSSTGHKKESISIDKKLVSHPLPPETLTPDGLRKRSRLHPNKLLVIYHCSFCDSAFEDYPSIKCHETEHIASEDPVLINSNPQTNYLGTKLIPGSSSKHCCPFCFKGFDTGALLRSHTRDDHRKNSRGKRVRRQQVMVPKRIKVEEPGKFEGN